MRPLKERPKELPEFTALVNRRRKIVFESIRQGETPSFRAYTPWAKIPGIKQQFLEAQDQCCAYCARLFSSSEGMTIDHFFPKSAISERNPVSDRLEPISRLGFWWKAYDWDNYLLCCGDCNEAKGSQFPVRENPRHPIPETLEETSNYLCTPLLLNPFDHKDMEPHFQYSDAGTLDDRSEPGRHTVAVIKLNRKRLVEQRLDIASQTFSVIEQYLRAESIATFSDAVTTLRELGDNGEWKYMVRSIFEQNTGTSWQKLLDPA